jgi:hypothetical protein
MTMMMVVVMMMMMVVVMVVMMMMITSPLRIITTATATHGKLSMAANYTREPASAACLARGLTRSHLMSRALLIHRRAAWSHDLEPLVRDGWPTESAAAVILPLPPSYS